MGTILGFPRMGQRRELKRMLESYWKNEIDAQSLMQESSALRQKHVSLLIDSGLSEIPVNDFSLYDHVLDSIVGFGAIPPRYKPLQDDFIRLYFAMARGERGANHNTKAMEMSKWFDTNYHYIIPEFTRDTLFDPTLMIQKLRHSIEEAAQIIKEKGATTKIRPVLLGPISFLLLGKSSDGSKVLDLLPRLLEAYCSIAEFCTEKGIATVQFDEPYLVYTLSKELQEAYKTAYKTVKDAYKGIEIFLASYFDDLAINADLVTELAVDIIHIDLQRSSFETAEYIAKRCKAISLGVIDGRNIWKAHISSLLSTLNAFLSEHSLQRCYIGSSCSLLHCPFDVRGETELDAEIAEWLSFSLQKVEEIQLLTSALSKGAESVATSIAQYDEAMQRRERSTQVHRAEVKKRVSEIDEAMMKRKSPYSERKETQKQRLQLPLFPTTTIGSYPQTAEIRKIRAAFKKQSISYQEYQDSMREEIRKVVDFQEEVGLDVLVHGEPERNDMVEYFGERFDGFVSTSNGWVQSYGSRCVKPPIIYGDLQRKTSITKEWISFAQSLTKKPMKGMLTGPVTILQWSFVRNDIPRSETAFQIALLVRDEIEDLEKEGIGIIQVDEPALREGLPLQSEKHSEYLDWAVKSFRVASSGVEDTTQIHTHMCYSEFNEIMRTIIDLDADVISIEASRSDMELLEAFKEHSYPNEIGPGIYDIHSPRIPSTEEMIELLQLARKYINDEQLWVNPDCGLKTRQWEEVSLALRNMVSAAHFLRTRK
ncbi:5-methyltetrahydropteroyltriglutamate--homocysteine methyltransferase-like [Ylistrum balloti]|uniref:5-methyltetrahydropteroyltriglutamate-- homocysteine methyltransferase-like n=1 Tax=Ylistrum balloti TaxID=509963 RepID=UPI002905E7F1|nr:5-methyltetrahydropteroyltriglutamate--homocysteine methyltransferase-like [Ylistrum balloti]